MINVINKSDGYVLMETAIMSICIISLTACMQFFKISAMNTFDCKARVSAEFIARECMDEISILGHSTASKKIMCNNIEFNVEENIESDINEKSKLAKVIVSWQYNNITHRICKEYKYYEEEK